MKKFIKYLLIGLGVIVLGLLVVGVFAKKEYDFKRGILIKANRNTVWEQVALWRNFNNWSPWFHLDTAMKQTIEGKDGETGCKYSWKSKEAGSGSMLNTVMDAMNRRVYDLKFEDMGGTSHCEMVLSDSADGTYITWSMSGKNDFVGAIFLTLMGGMEGAVGKDYNQGLENLKKYCEAHPAANYSLGEISVKTFPHGIFAQNRREMKISEYLKSSEGVMGEMFAGLNKYVATNQLKPAGNTYGIYYVWDEKADKTIFSAAMAVDKKGPGDGTAENGCVEFENSEAVCMDFMGSYEGIKNAHDAILKWIFTHNKSVGNATLEEYVVGPMQDKNPAKWHTRIWYLLKK